MASSVADGGPLLCLTLFPSEILTVVRARDCSLWGFSIDSEIITAIGYEVRFVSWIRRLVFGTWVIFFAFVLHTWR